MDPADKRHCKKFVRREIAFNPTVSQGFNGDAKTDVGITASEELGPRRGHSCDASRYLARKRNTPPRSIPEMAPFVTGTSEAIRVRRWRPEYRVWNTDLLFSSRSILELVFGFTSGEY